MKLASSAVCSQRGIAQSFEDNDGPTKVYVRYTDITCPSGGNRGVITSIRSNKDNDPSSPRSTIDKTLQRHASNALSFRLFRHHHRSLQRSRAYFLLSRLKHYIFIKAAKNCITRLLALLGVSSVLFSLLPRDDMQTRSMSRRLHLCPVTRHVCISLRHSGP